MLKPIHVESVNLSIRQPPSGGCVLKLGVGQLLQQCHPAAAFGRLCVETNVKFLDIGLRIAAAFGRLCVETSFVEPVGNR